MEVNSTIVPILKSDSRLKNYYCPHCGRLVMKGNVNRLKMNCPHCLTLIDATGAELLEMKTEDNGE